MNRTRIETFDYTWNPFVGCMGPAGDQVRCGFCYAARLARRRMSKCVECNAFTPHWHLERLAEPAKVRKPSRIFVNSMGDPADFEQSDVDRLMRSVPPRHRYYLLTKRPWAESVRSVAWPPWWCVGVSVGESELSWERLYHLDRVQGCPSLFVSVEPLRSEPNLRALGCVRGLSWVIVGEETGPGFDHNADDVLRWAVRVRDLAIAKGVPCYVKRPLRTRPWGWGRDDLQQYDRQL